MATTTDVTLTLRRMIVGAGLSLGLILVLGFAPKLWNPARGVDPNVGIFRHEAGNLVGIFRSITELDGNKCTFRVPGYPAFELQHELLPRRNPLLKQR